MKIQALKSVVTPVFCEAKATNSVTSNVKELTEPFSKEYAKSCDAMAKMQINLQQSKFTIPQFFYHLTPKSAFESIKNGGQITLKRNLDPLKGIYLIDKKNFLGPWQKMTYGDFSEADNLFLYTSRGEDAVLIQIPAEKLNLKNMHFRSYDECKGAKDEKAGIHSMKELGKYLKRGDIIEYIYHNDIPFEHCAKTTVIPNNIDWTQTFFTAGLGKGINSAIETLE